MNGSVVSDFAFPGPLVHIETLNRKWRWVHTLDGAGIQPQGFDRKFVYYVPPLRGDINTMPRKFLQINKIREAVNDCINNQGGFEVISMITRGEAGPRIWRNPAVLYRWSDVARAVELEASHSSIEVAAWPENTSIGIVCQKEW